MYVNANCNDQDSDYAEVYNGMNEDGNSTGVHVSEFNDPGSCW